jgi:hypothetical protein
MKHLNNFESFSINEQRTLAALDELCNVDEINEGLMDWIKKIGDFFERINDSIKSLMLTMMEKGWKALIVVEKFIDKILEKIKAFKEKHPVFFRTVIITLVLLILFFVLCSAASAKDAVPTENMLNMAIGMLRKLQIRGGGNYNSGTIMRAQAYLFELRKTGMPVSNPVFGKEAIDLANNALKAVHDNIIKVNKVPEYQKDGQLNYLVDCLETGSRMLGYKIVEYQNALTRESSGEEISVAFKAASQ